MADKGCCKTKMREGILYGLVPHIGCIAFIVASILGSTVLIGYFKPLLMSRNIFYYLILVSVGFATLGSFFYLKKHGDLSFDGIKRRKGYLGIMYGSTVGVNIVLLFFIFPFLANFVVAGVDDVSRLELLKISVDIPCPGHAPLISSELSMVEGVQGVEYSFPNNFDVYYNGVGVDEILSLEVFEEYPAVIVGEVIEKEAVSSGGCGGGCGGKGTCGGSCGSSSCSYNS